MTIDIRITTLDPSQYGPDADQIEQALASLGFIRQRPGYEMKRVLTGNAETDHNTMVEEQQTGAATEAEAEAIADAGGSLSGPAAPTRERGQPSAGRARRTKAEIKEDEQAAADDADAANHQAEKRAEPVAAISTGEERLSPEDTPEDAAADAADEAAETAATKTDKLTTEDVRNGMGIYVTKYGIEAIQLDGLEVFNRVLGPCPLKNEKNELRTWKVSDLPDDQTVLKRIVDGFVEMTSLNPFKRTAKVA